MTTFRKCIEEALSASQSFFAEFEKDISIANFEEIRNRSNLAKDFDDAIFRRLEPIFGLVSPLLDTANPGDIVFALDWLQKYEMMLASIHSLPTTTLIESCHHSKGMRISSLWKYHDTLLELFIDGGSNGTKFGAKGLLVEHCQRVWSTFLSAPESMLQCKRNGAFYTTVAVDIWEIINENHALISTTSCFSLMLRMIHSYVECLLTLSKSIQTFSANLCISNNAQSETDSPSTADYSEFELICAMVNDSIFHVEQILQFSEMCSRWWQRDKAMMRIGRFAVQLFEPSAAELLHCGRKGLELIVSIIISDIKPAYFQKLLTAEWVNGGKEFVETALLTVSDYLKDLIVFLLPFWHEQLSSAITLEFSLEFAFSILQNTCPDLMKRKISDFLSSMYGNASTGKKYLPFDDELLSRLCGDISSIKIYFSKIISDPQTLLDCTSILTDIQLLLTLDTDEAICYACSLTASDEAIYLVTERCFQLKNGCPASSTVSSWRPLIHRQLNKCSRKHSSKNESHVAPFNQYHRLCKRLKQTDDDDGFAEHSLKERKDSLFIILFRALSCADELWQVEIAKLQRSLWRCYQISSHLLQRLNSINFCDSSNDDWQIFDYCILVRRSGITLDFSYMLTSAKIVGENKLNLDGNKQISLSSIRFMSIWASPHKLFYNKNYHCVLNVPRGETVDIEVNKKAKSRFNEIFGNKISKAADVNSKVAKPFGFFKLGFGSIMQDREQIEAVTTESCAIVSIELMDGEELLVKESDPFKLSQFINAVMMASELIYDPSLQQWRKPDTRNEFLDEANAWCSIDTGSDEVCGSPTLKPHCSEEETCSKKLKFLFTFSSEIPNRSEYSTSIINASKCVMGEGQNIVSTISRQKSNFSLEVQDIMDVCCINDISALPRADRFDQNVVIPKESVPQDSIFGSSDDVIRKVADNSQEIIEVDSSSTEVRNLNLLRCNDPTCPADTDAFEPWHQTTEIFSSKLDIHGRNSMIDQLQDFCSNSNAENDYPLTSSTLSIEESGPINKDCNTNLELDPILVSDNAALIDQVSCRSSTMIQWLNLQFFGKGKTQKEGNYCCSSKDEISEKKSILSISTMSQEGIDWPQFEVRNPLRMGGGIMNDISVDSTSQINSISYVRESSEKHEIKNGHNSSGAEIYPARARSRQIRKRRFPSSTKNNISANREVKILEHEIIKSVFNPTDILLVACETQLKSAPHSVNVRSEFEHHNHSEVMSGTSQESAQRQAAEIDLQSNGSLFEQRDIDSTFGKPPQFSAQQTMPSDSTKSSDLSQSLSIFFTKRSRDSPPPPSNLIFDSANFSPTVDLDEQQRNNILLADQLKFGNFMNANTETIQSFHCPNPNSFGTLRRTRSAPAPPPNYYQ